MAFSTPYETGQYVAYLDHVVTTTLSFAVQLIDDLTKTKPLATLR